MGTSNISGIGKVVVQAQMQGVKGGEKEENLQVAFCEVMSQMQTCVGEGLPSNTQEIKGNDCSVSTKSTADTEYERYGSHGVKIEKGSDAGKVEEEQMTEKLDAFAEDVKEVLKEELGVSEEQIEAAMEALGLQFSDLLIPTQLAALVGELTGIQDMGALLCSEEFTTIMQAVGELGEDLLQELGISGEELAQLLTETQDAAKPETDTQMVPEENTLQDAEVQKAADSATASQTVSAAVREEEPAKAVEPTEESLPEEEKPVVHEKTVANEQQENPNGQETLEDNEGQAQTSVSDSHKNGDSFGQQMSENPAAQTRNDMTGLVNQNMTETAFVQTGENVNGTAGTVDVSDIIKQIVEFSRVTLSNSATTMELQLAPENLGKIYMAVTAKDGVVSAHITAQNEAVKEALESQLVELKQSMNQAGIKVEAVEVTVGSHEFEKNLEQNAKQEQRQAEDQEKAAKQTRRIHLSDLSELSGVMTEEENLVVQMMAVQGNSVDFTA